MLDLASPYAERQDVMFFLVKLYEIHFDELDIYDFQDLVTIVNTINDILSKNLSEPFELYGCMFTHNTLQLMLHAVSRHAENILYVEGPIYSKAKSLDYVELFVYVIGWCR